MLKEKRPKILGHIQMLWDKSAMMNKFAFTGKQLEYICEWDGEEGKLVEALENCRLIDKKEDYYELHDWLEHAPNYIKRKLKYDEKKVKENVIEEENYEAKDIKPDDDIYSFNEKEIIERILGLEGKLDVVDEKKLIINMVKKYFREGYSDLELKDELKKVYDQRFWRREKDVGKMKNEKAFILAYIKKTLT
jgi:hypothetical protein